MKVRFLYPAVFLAVSSMYFLMLSLQEGPESRIVGEWKEVSWEYEKVDSLIHRGPDYLLADHIGRLTDLIKSQIAKSLIVHEAEVWRFGTDETLHMLGDSLTKETRWKLKGRGNILQISGADSQTEHYKIQELTPTRMVLHFNTDMQVRGIVKITFERINA